MLGGKQSEQCMGVRRRLFHHHDRNGDEDWYYLARDADTGGVWIEHKWDYRGPDSGSDKIAVGVFLTASAQGTKQDRLLNLIGTLVPEEG